MMTQKIRKAGRWVLLVGIALLISAIVVSYLWGSVAMQVLFLLSMLVNTAAIMMLRWRDPD